jgi:hypothetical protein
MRPITALIVFSLCIALRYPTAADDKKKHLVVAAGKAAQQVNNHPWSYTAPGQANTNCTGSGTVNGTATDTGYGTTNINGTVNTNTDCNTTYTPPRTTSGNRITVDNAAWVTDVATGDEYLIQCTANWVGSKCSYLNDGNYKADLEGNNMKITGMKGMKEMTAKYHVLRFIPSGRVPSVATVTSTTSSTQTSTTWTPDETYVWQMYRSISPEDKDYVQVFCAANPKGAALLPRSKVVAGQGAEHALDCASWISAKSKSQ